MATQININVSGMNFSILYNSCDIWDVYDFENKRVVSGYMSGKEFIPQIISDRVYYFKSQLITKTSKALLKNK